MFTLMIGISATGIAAGVGLAASRQRHRRLRAALGIPAQVDPARSAQFRRAMREFAEAETRIRRRSPHLNERQRRELALNLVRARGLLDEAGRTH